MDFTSPRAFCASAITVLASCASALPQRNASPTLIKASFLNTGPPYEPAYEPGCQAKRTVLSILYRLGLLSCRRDFGDRDALRLHQRFQQHHGFRKCVGTAASTTGASRDVEGRTAAGVFSGKVGAIGAHGL